MGAYPGGRIGFAVAATLTHAVVGYVLGAILFRRPGAGAVGGLVADGDHVLELIVGPPFVHRGITHSALAVGVAAAVAGRRDRRLGGAVGVGYRSHLVIDATTPLGVTLAYPFSTANVGVVAYGHAPRTMAILWVAFAVALAADHRSRPQYAVDRV